MWLTFWSKRQSYVSRREPKSSYHLGWLQGSSYCSRKCNGPTLTAIFYFTGGCICMYCALAHTPASQQSSRSNNHIILEIGSRKSIHGRELKLNLEICVFYTATLNRLFFKERDDLARMYVCPDHCVPPHCNSQNSRPIHMGHNMLLQPISYAPASTLAAVVSAGQPHRFWFHGFGLGDGLFTSHQRRRGR
jgi:hypothetical protein